MRQEGLRPAPVIDERARYPWRGMPHVQAIVVVAAVWGAAFLAVGLFRVWGIAAAWKWSRSPNGHLRLPSPGAKERRRQPVFALVYLLLGAYLLYGARPRVVWLREPAAAGPAEGLAGEVEKLLAARRSRVGLVVGVVRGGESDLLLTGTLGLSSGERPRAETLYPIGSITKAFTGILLADMSARGEVDLADPVRRYLPPGVAPRSWKGREINLLDLATHASGLPRMPPYMAPTAKTLLTWRLLRDRYRGHTVDELFERLGTIPLSARPGESFVYSNLGLGLLGHALERAAGRNYEALIRDRIALPLGMSGTRVELPEDLAARLAPGFFDVRHLGAFGVEFPAPRWQSRVLHGAGALVSSGEDLLRFLEANLRPPATPLGEAIRLSHRPRRARDGGGGGIGLGWHLTSISEEAGELVWHSGATSGYTSFLGFLPGRGAGLFVLNNTAEPVDEMARAILDRIVQRQGTER